MRGTGGAFVWYRRRFLRRLATAAALPFFPRRALSSPSHHLSDGSFRNNYIGAINKPFGDLMRWRREAPSVRVLSFPLATNDPGFLAGNRDRATLTWIGHATVLLQLGGYNILTDPHFSERASPLSFAGPKRGTPPGLALADLPPLDAVLISHNHYDHLDSDSIAALAKQQPQAHFFTPLRLRSTLSQMGAKKVSELDWGEGFSLGALRLVAEPCQHWSSRAPWDRNKTLWASWVAEVAGRRFLFIGDTGYSKDFADLGEKYGSFDVAVIPIGAYEPRWFMQDAHVAPHESAQIFLDLRARFAVASHWGTFSLTDEAMDQPPRQLAQALEAAGIDKARFVVFQHGQTRELPFLAA